MTHIDDWTNKAAMSRDLGERYASFFFFHKRLPATLQIAYELFLTEHKLFCTYEGARYRVTGASRMGDVWLAKDYDREHGYDLRVDVDECSDWGSKP